MGTERSTLGNFASKPAHKDAGECGSCGEPALAQTSAQAKWLRIAIGLVISTMLYNIAEAAIATVTGRKVDSIALFGFGLDSIIECAAASMMLWQLYARLRQFGGPELERRERLVRRFIGGTFVALAVYIFVEAGFTLWKAEAPAKTPVGIALAVASLVIMPSVSFAKLRAARELGSRALRAEAKETLVCSYLSLTLLVGLALNSWRGWWWADPIAALLMVPWLVKEGVEGLRGDECCDDD